jgi:RNA-binding motif protein, X-linked 2
VPTWIKLARDKETGKSRGFGWLKYEDQRSCDLAVDNIGGATVLGRVLRVDHTRYKKKDGEEEEDEKFTIRVEGAEKKVGNHQDDEGSDSEEARKLRWPKTKAEKELESLIRNHDEDDPMKEYLVNQKREEVTAELEALESSKKGSRRHRHRHDRRRDEERDDREKRKHRDRSRERRHRSDSPDRPRRHRSQDRQRRSTPRDRSTERRHRR